MSRDQVLGFGMVIVSIIVIAAYAWLVFLSDLAIMILKLTGFAAILAVFGILAWIGYTLATTPPPKPIEEIEKEIEDELKKLESSAQKPAVEESKGS